MPTLAGPTVVDPAPAPGSPVVYRKAIAFNSSGISNGTGFTLFTPTIGDILYDVWVEVNTAWNGTTPKFDVGTGVASTAGLFSFLGIPVNMTSAEAESDGTGILFTGAGGGDNLSLNAAGGQSRRVVPAKFTAANPLKCWVTQDAALNGANPGASQGTAVVYVVIATPAAL